MRLPWPFRRQSPPASPGHAQAADGADPPSLIRRSAWRDLPTLQRTLEPPPLVAPPRPFKQGLAGAQQFEPMIQRLAHERSGHAPAGLIKGIVTVLRSAAAEPLAPAGQGIAMHLGRAMDSAGRWLRRRPASSTTAVSSTADDAGAPLPAADAGAPGPAAGPVKAPSAAAAEPAAAPPIDEIMQSAAPGARERPSVATPVSRTTPGRGTSRFTTVGPAGLTLLRQRTSGAGSQAMQRDQVRDAPRPNPSSPPSQLVTKPSRPAPGSSIQRVVGPMRRVRLGPPLTGKRELSGQVQRAASAATDSAEGGHAAPSTESVSTPASASPTPAPSAPERPDDPLQHRTGAPLVLRRSARAGAGGDDHEAGEPARPQPVPATAGEPETPADAGHAPALPRSPAVQATGNANVAGPASVGPVNVSVNRALASDLHAESFGQAAPSGSRVARRSVAGRRSVPLSADRPLTAARPPIRLARPGQAEMQRSVSGTVVAARSRPVEGSASPAAAVNAPQGPTLRLPSAHQREVQATGAAAPGQPASQRPLSVPAQRSAAERPKVVSRTQRARATEGDTSPSDVWTLPAEMALPSRPAVSSLGSAQDNGAAVIASTLQGGSTPVVARSASPSSTTPAAPPLPSPYVQAQPAEGAEVSAETADMGGAGGPGGAMGEREMEDLLRRLYPKLRVQLARELLVARERAGLLTDLH